MNDNILLMTDSYKLTHWKQYPPKTTNVYSYFEARGGEVGWTMFFGLQYFLKKYLEGYVVTPEKVLEAENFVARHLGSKEYFNRAGWERIAIRYSGKLPVSICAVPEGSIHKYHTPLMTIENTDPELFWLTNYLETLLVQCWYPTSVATASKQIKDTILLNLSETGDPSLADFKLHDFGFRGVSSPESAGIGDAAHLVNFQGTDTIAGIRTLERFYNPSAMPGFSIPATEHSTITSWGELGEADAYRNLLKQFPTGLLACVSDSFDIYNACKNLWGTELVDEVKARKGCLVIRPDSGDPVEVICRVLEILSEKFGYETNKKGYKVLHPSVRVIQGDGVDLKSIKEILMAMKIHGFSGDNIAFGMGGALLQKLNRDTHSFAFKCSSVVIDGVEKDVKKRPVTDPSKNSTPGRFTNHLTEVFRDGEITESTNLDEVRRHANERCK